MLPDDTSPDRDLVVIGASAGGVEVLIRVVAGLPESLAAAVCIVLHVAPDTPSALAPILQRAGPLPCRFAEDSERLRQGEILVAPPDRHMVIADGDVDLTLGPRENGHRPSVDCLFRSAATNRGSHVIGVVLSGTRDDGAAGLAAIKAHGGGVIVQDPQEALYAGMPASALANVAADAVAPSRLIATTIAAMVSGGDLPPDIAVSDGPAHQGPEAGVTTICPECGGVLRERQQAGMTQWECRVGHRYSPDSLADAQANGVEASLWAAVRALEDRHLLLSRMADQAEARQQLRSARSFRRRAKAAAEHAHQVRAALTEAAATTLRMVEQGEDIGAAGEESAA